MDPRGRTEVVQPGFFDPEPEPEPEPEPVDPTEVQRGLERLLAASQRLLALMAQYEPERANKPAWVELRDSTKAMEALMSNGLLLEDLMSATGQVGITHPPTSHQASRLVRAGTQRHHLLWLVSQSGTQGLTSFEATKDMRAVRPNMSPNQTATRMGELRDDFGYVARRTHLGKVVTRQAAKGEAEVYVITPSGADALTRLGKP